MLIINTVRYNITVNNLFRREYISNNVIIMWILHVVDHTHRWIIANFCAEAKNIKRFSPGLKRHMLHTRKIRSTSMTYAYRIVARFERKKYDAIIMNIN